MRELVFAAVLAVAGSLITTGVALIFSPAAWIIGGVLLALWSWLALGDAA